jgi:hypothetical protein
MTTFRFKKRTTPQSISKQVIVGLYALCLPTVLAADGIVVPSGQPVSFIEFISEESTNTVRFRFLTPEIGKSYQYMDVAHDFQVVCDELVMPALIENAIEPSQIVLSMSAANIPFGEDDPNVLQFFEIFSPENGTCIWEEF